jgi:hypothetical protein
MGFEELVRVGCPFRQQFRGEKRRHENGKVFGLFDLTFNFQTLQSLTRPKIIKNYETK